MPESPNTDESIFAAAALLPVEQRAAHLVAACGDAAQRERVEQLLRSHQEAGSFLEGPPIAARTAEFAPLTEKVGGVIGRYKLLQIIGEGGFGVVYMAEQKEPIRRKVALKVIKLGMDSKEVVARFEAERQALALMDHPNIARVLDAGATETGRPYFVMELVKGVPIVEFCDKNQLPTRERLAIFAAICQAVQHAHQKGIIHRDLKPSNVLVTLHDGKPVPKVIDFGVAKALNQELTEKTLFTAYGHMVGTPQYMSPEQAKMSGLDVDTRSDIYSLGVLLYELLTGTTPLEARRLRSAGIAEMQRMIREEEPPRPSMRLSTLGERLSVIAKDRQSDPMNLQRLLHGEIDWIVMKALEKERGRRYDTATAMGKDVERYLAGDTVEACPPSAGYRLRKFVRKHRKALSLTAAFALLMVVGLVVTTWLAVDANKKAELLAAAEQVALGDRDVARNARDELRSNQDELRSNRDELRSSLYAARANLIQTAWRSDNMSRVRQLLDQQRPKAGEADLRGFEWHYYKRLANSDLRTVDLAAEFSSHLSGVYLSRDGSRVAAVTPIDKSNDSLVRVWELASEKVLFSTRVNFAHFSIAFSDDGKRLAMAMNPPARLFRITDDKAKPSGRLVVWDCDTGAERFAADANLDNVALSRDGRRVATVQRQDLRASHEPGDSAETSGKMPKWAKAAPMSVAQDIKVWDVDTHKELAILRDVKPSVLNLTFSPDGGRLAAILSRGPGAASELRFWDVFGKERWKTELSPAEASVQFSPDGTRLVCSTFGNIWMSSWQKYELNLYDAGDGKKVSSIASPAPLRQVVFNPDGKLLAGGAGPNVQVFDAVSQELVTLKGHSAVVQSVAFSAATILTVVSVEVSGVVKTWAAPKFIDAQSPDEKMPYRCDLSPDKTYRLKYVMLAPGPVRHSTADIVETDIKVLDLAGKLLRAFEGHAAVTNRIEISRNGRFVISGDTRNKTLVWEAATGKQRLILDGTKYWVMNASGTRLAGWTVDGALKVWDLNDLQEKLNLPDPNAYLVFSPDGNRLLLRYVDYKAGAHGRKGRLWDVDKGREIGAIPCGEDPMPCVFDAANKRLAVIDGTEVAIWDASTGSKVTTLRCPEAVNGLAISAEGASVATYRRTSFSPFGRLSSPSALTEANNSIEIWDVAAGKVRCRLNGHTTTIFDVGFSPDGKRIVSLASGHGIGLSVSRGEVKLWDAATGAEIMELRGDDMPLPAFNIVFNDKGTQLSIKPPLGALSQRRVESLIWDGSPLPEK